MNLIDFYLGNAPDHRGRMLDDLLRWSDQKLEAGHDFIQVLFPLPEPSERIPNAPVLDAASQAEFQRNPLIQKNLLRSLQLMLRFYGFQLNGRDVVTAADFDVRAANWRFAGDHNHYRITRILKCLTICGLRDHSTAFLDALLRVAEPGKVSTETVGYWKRAVQSPSE